MTMSAEAGEAEASEPMAHRRCVQCWTPLDGRRKHARFCSDVCRATAWRAEKRSG